MYSDWGDFVEKLHIMVESITGMLENESQKVDKTLTRPQHRLSTLLSEAQISKLDYGNVAWGATGFNTLD